jgi:hypothetical protein
MNSCKNCKIFNACVEADVYEYFSQQEQCKLYYPIENEKEYKKEEQPSKFQIYLNSQKFTPLSDDELNNKRNEALKLLED